MVGKRERVARLLDGVGLSRALVSLRRIARPLWLPVLTYHRVGARRPDDFWSADSYDALSHQFDEQLAFLAQHFTFITTQQVADFLDGTPLPPNPVLISFDDGYTECKDVALPLLRKHGATATFFIATDYVDRRRLFWWDRLELLVSRSPRERIQLTYPRPLDLRRDEATDVLTKLVKTEYGLDLERLLEHLGECTGVVLSPEEEADVVERLVMTWDDIRALRDEGMDIQSHTRSHRIVQTLADADLAEEFQGSKLALERELGTTVHTLAYPVGYPIGAAPAIRSALTDAGYRMAFNNQTGAIATWKSHDAHNLSRIGMSSHFSLAFFRSLMALPLLAHRNRATPRP